MNRGLSLSSAAKGRRHDARTRFDCLEASQMLRKIVFVLLLAALAMLVARLAYDPPVIRTRVVTTAVETSAPVLAPPLMYAGIRG